MPYTITLTGASKLLNFSHSALNCHWQAFHQGRQSKLISYLIKTGGLTPQEIKSIHFVGMSLDHFRLILDYYLALDRDNMDLSQLRKFRSMNDDQLKAYIEDQNIKIFNDQYSVTVTLSQDIRDRIKRDSDQKQLSVPSFVSSIIEHHYLHA